MGLLNIINGFINHCCIEKEFKIAFLTVSSLNYKATKNVFILLGEKFCLSSKILQIRKKKQETTRKERDKRKVRKNVLNQKVKWKKVLWDEEG
jgi:hypothetical protein